MKICLDLRTAVNGHHGIARYGIELTRALQALGTSHRFCLLTPKAKDWEGLRKPDTSVFRCSASPYSLEEQLLVPFAVARIRPDIYHCPTYACPLFVPRPTLFTIHDLLPLERPEGFSPALRLYHRSVVRWMARRARRIVTVSSYTLRAVCNRLSVPSQKVRAILSGGDHIQRQPISAQDQKAYQTINPDDLDYFLSIANPRPHKNILFSMECFLSSATLRQRKVLYILVGQQHPSVHAYAQGKDRDDRIRFAGGVSEGLLRLLYQKAVALLSPSVGEGFCLPAVEALQFGLPVIAAKDGALPEVLGSVGLLLPPRNALDWREAIEHVHETKMQGTWDPSPVIERARRFTWARAAEQTMALYEEVYEEEGLRS